VLRHRRRGRQRGCRRHCSWRSANRSSRPPPRPDTKPARIVARANDELCEEADAGMFVTLLFAVLNTRSGELEVCNAGHLPPFLFGANDSITPLRVPRAPALALAPDLVFPTERYHLEPGDALFFFTDGVTEALSPERGFLYAGTPRGCVARRPGAGRRENHACGHERCAGLLRRTASNPTTFRCWPCAGSACRTTAHPMPRKSRENQPSHLLKT